MQPPPGAGRFQRLARGLVVDHAQVDAFGRIIAVDAVNAAPEGNLSPVGQRQYNGRQAAFVAEAGLGAPQREAAGGQVLRECGGGAADGAAGLLEPGKAALAVAHRALHQLVNQRRDGLVGHGFHPFLCNVGKGLFLEGQTGEVVESGVVEGAGFDGINLPFLQNVRPEAIGDEVAEGAVGILLQTAHAEHAVAVQAARLLRWNGLGGRIVMNAAQKPHGVRCGGRGALQLFQPFLPAVGHVLQAVLMGAQLQPQLPQRLRGAQGKRIGQKMRNAVFGKEALGNGGQQRQRPQRLAVGRGAGIAEK